MTEYVDDGGDEMFGVENPTPTPHNENPNPESVIPKKKISNNPSGRPAGRGKILPAHRVIFQHYKDQGFKHLGKAIRKTNVYSEDVAKRVNIITKSKSWQALMAQYMPDELIAMRHSELLDKRDYRKVTQADGTTIEVDNGPDTAAVSKGLEMAYKLKGSFKKEEEPKPSTVMYNLFYKPEVRNKIKEFEDGIKQNIFNEIRKKNARDLRDEEENTEAGADTSGSGESEAVSEQSDTESAG